MDRVPLFRIQSAERVFRLGATPEALLVDVEGTLTGFSPSGRVVVESLARFDRIAGCAGLDLRYLHYVTNADFEQSGAAWAGVYGRFHCRARKPLFAPGDEFRLGGRRTLVVGDQYLTDGLLAWRFGFSFALVESVERRPTWPRAQFYVGQVMSRLFFEIIEK